MIVLDPVFYARMKPIYDEYLSRSNPVATDVMIPWAYRLLFDGLGETGVLTRNPVARPTKAGRAAPISDSAPAPARERRYRAPGSR
jgi:hypothetical protein